MKLTLSFNDGNSKEYVTALKNNKPIELQVDAVSDISRTQCLQAYLGTLEYLLTGVTNRYTEAITAISLGSTELGYMRKNEDDTAWNFTYDRTNVVLYKVNRENLTENFYVSDGLDQKRTSWLTNLIQGENELIAQKMIHVIAVVSKYFGDKYALSFAKNSLVLKNRKGKVINISDILEDDIYIFMKLMNVIIPKGEHYGAFMVDCTRMSEQVLTALSEVVAAIYKDSVIFMYNCDKDLELKRDCFKLTNFMDS